MGTTPPPLSMGVVSTVTLIPVEGGFAPGVTVRYSVTLPLGHAFPLVLPTPLGGVWLGQVKGGETLLRGVGAPAEKSEALLFASSQPFEPRIAAVLLLSTGAGPEPSKQFTWLV